MTKSKEIKQKAEMHEKTQGLLCWPPPPGCGACPGVWWMQHGFIFKCVFPGLLSEQLSQNTCGIPWDPSYSACLWVILVPMDVGDQLLRCPPY